MGLLDIVDGMLATTLTRRQAMNEARAFARSCREGVPYFSIEECVQPWGNEPRAQEWVFRRERFLGLRCGPHDPAYVWLNYGPLLDDPGPVIRPLFERAAGEDPPSEAQLQAALLAAVAGMQRKRSDLASVR